MAYFDTGERIRELRRERGLNQDQLAELASLNRVTIAKYESGRVEPGAHALARIADALEVTTDALLGRSDEPVTQTQAPKSPQINIVSGEMEKMTQEQQDRVINILRAVYSNDPDFFN